MWNVHKSNGEWEYVRVAAIRAIHFLCNFGAVIFRLNCDRIQIFRSSLLCFAATVFSECRLNLNSAKCCCDFGCLSVRNIKSLEFALWFWSLPSDFFICERFRYPVDYYVWNCHWVECALIESKRYTNTFIVYDRNLFSELRAQPLRAH